MEDRKLIKETGISGGGIVAAQYALPELFLGKWLFAGSLAMVYAQAGIGKTFFSMALAYAVAAGNTNFLGWWSKKPKRVLYVDSEMGYRLLRERLIKIIESNERDADKDSIKFISYEDCERQTIWNLADEHDQKKYTEAAEDFDLIIIDNLSGCARSIGRETEFQSWPRVQDWLLKMRRAGKCVLLLHHASKTAPGEKVMQRGPSMRVDALDFVVALNKPREHKPEEGLRFTLEFEKCRHYIGAESKKIDVRLTDFEGERMHWLWEEYISEARIERKRGDLFG